MPTWNEVRAKYGDEMCRRMEKTGYLTGITVTLLPNGEANIPQRDIDLAYRAATGQYIHPEEWD